MVDRTLPIPHAVPLHIGLRDCRVVEVMTRGLAHDVLESHASYLERRTEQAQIHTRLQNNPRSAGVSIEECAEFLDAAHATDAAPIEYFLRAITQPDTASETARNRRNPVIAQFQQMYAVDQGVHKARTLMRNNAFVFALFDAVSRVIGRPLPSDHPVYALDAEDHAASDSGTEPSESASEWASASEADDADDAPPEKRSRLDKEPT